MNESQPEPFGLTHAEAIARGDREIWGHIFTTYSSELRAYLATQTGNPDTAEDLTQIVFLKALTSCDSWGSNGEHNLRAWLYLIARRSMIDGIRHDRIRPSIPLEIVDASFTHPSDIENEVITTDTYRELRRRITDTLTPAQRNVITSRFFDEQSILETAARFGYTPLQVRSLQFRGLRALRKALGDQKE